MNPSGADLDGNETGEQSSDGGEESAEYQGEQAAEQSSQDTLDDKEAETTEVRSPSAVGVQ